MRRIVRHRIQDFLDRPSEKKAPLASDASICRLNDSYIQIARHVSLPVVVFVQHL
jgi:hypothetical protein